eukprot:scaffold91178_cov34-Phaeocystis_antarctica.AAC.1
MESVRGNDRACGAAVGVRSLQIRRVTRVLGPSEKLSAAPEVRSSVPTGFHALNLGGRGGRRLRDGKTDRPRQR